MENLQDFKPHSLSVDEALKQLDVDGTKGLTDDEVKSRREKYGPNILSERKQRSIWAILFDQVKSPIVYLLLAASGVSFAFGDLPEGIAILVVLLINAIIGFMMEYQARQSMKALEQMDKIEAKALRNGKIEQLDAEQLVPGDILTLEQGDMPAADARLIEAAEIQVNESALTGESAPVEKNTEPIDSNTPVADRTNMLFKGTGLTMGKAKAVVTGIGMNTEMGSISEMVGSTRDDEIPLNQKLNSLTKRLIWLVAGMAVALTVVTFVTGNELYVVIQTAIAWAIAAIPEGLPIVASIALAKGMLRLASHNVVVKRLASVETLGETNVIFTDKTGTLTENRLTVVKIGLPGNTFDVQWEHDQIKLPGDLKEDKSMQLLHKVSTLCNDAHYDDKDETKSQGDPLEIALLKFASFHDKERMDSYLKLERAGEDPFDSESKMMGVITAEDGKHFVSAKGASDSILEACTRILIDGEALEFTSEDKNQWKELNDKMANQGLRALAFAYRETVENPGHDPGDFFLEDLTLIGLIGFLDPPQKGVREAMMRCRKAGIDVIMVTGDHPGTAKNIAMRVGLIDDDNAPVIHGSDLENGKTNDEQILAGRVFSRVSPAQKYEIVELFQKNSKIVGMTGDGVNDAPALKRADIGIAMGLRGTQVAKEVADMVLKDDSFSSIVKAVKQGRIIFSNIRKFIVYQLSYHLGEALVIAVAAFSVFQPPLLPLQLLFLNILLDVFPALALGIGEGRDGIMKEKPKDPEESIIHKRGWQTIAIYGIVIASVISGAYFYGYYAMGLSFEICNNIAFFSLGFSQLLHTLDMRDHDESVFVNQVTTNKYVWIALAFGFVMMGLTYFHPGLSDLLKLQRLDANVWIVIATASAMPMIFIQIIKKAFKF